MNIAFDISSKSFENLWSAFPVFTPVPGLPPNVTIAGAVY